MTKSKVIHLYQRDPQEALERLNRITGLCFARWPESLAHGAAETEPVQVPRECIERGEVVSG
ncbi:hypothetical protein HP532_04400 [Pseudomonas sp. CrR25]|nr:hypothetical protein [Pseudomonas sp. CrR25]